MAVTGSIYIFASVEWQRLSFE